jgi:hypothetical protein
MSKKVRLNRGDNMKKVWTIEVGRQTSRMARDKSKKVSFITFTAIIGTKYISTSTSSLYLYSGYAPENV